MVRESVKAPPVPITVTVEIVRRSGLSNFLGSKIDAARTAMKQASDTLFEDTIYPGLAEHMDAPGSTGRLLEAVEESRTLSVVNKTETRLVYQIGIGHIPTLESIAPHWKYIEYGTGPLREAEAWEPPPRPGENRPKRTEPYEGARPLFKNRLGRRQRAMGPNRTWRRARYAAGFVLDDELKRIFRDKRGRQFR